MSFGKSSNESEPLSPAEVQAYFDRLNQNTGGRLSAFAVQGTPSTVYERLTPDQIKALGGLGATQRADLEASRERQREEIGADPSLTLAQRQRARQLVDQDLNARLNAIAKESEAAITGLASQEAMREYESAAQNAELTREDLIALANIFFGGQGQESESDTFRIGFGS